MLADIQAMLECGERWEARYRVFNSEQQNDKNVSIKMLGDNQRCSEDFAW